MRNKTASMLDELVKYNPIDLSDESRKLFDTIMNLIDDRDKYKRLYNNEVEHTKTLYEIIKRINKDVYEAIKDVHKQ